MGLQTRLECFAWWRAIAGSVLAWRPDKISGNGRFCRPLKYHCLMSKSVLDTTCPEE
jgi:hypothetical protein